MLAQNQLSTFAILKGIGSASGLFLKQNLLYVIGDNSAHLYEYNVSNQSLNKIEIVSGSRTSENIPKSEKPDFEVLCHFNDILYILASGSRQNRNLLISYHLKTEKVLTQDLSTLYTSIKNIHHIDDDNLNIEGAVIDGKNWFLFNRGNGNANKNGVFKIYGTELTKANRVEFSPINLLKTDGRLVSFTDAILHQDQIYFLAAAEDTKSTYDDGKILGSYIGCISPEMLTLKYTKQISSNQKFEGITFYRESEKVTEFLICEDRDDELLKTVIYKLTIQK